MEITKEEISLINKVRKAKNTLVIMVLEATPDEREMIRLTTFGKDKRITLQKSLEIMADAEKRIKNLIE